MNCHRLLDQRVCQHFKAFLQSFKNFILMLPEIMSCNSIANAETCHNSSCAQTILPVTPEETPFCCSGKNPKAKLLGKDGFPSSQDTSWKKGLLQLQGCEWTYSGMFSALCYMQVDHNIHKRESILAPAQNKASKGKLKPAGTEQLQNITSGSDGKLLPPADKRKQSHLELQTLHTGSLQDTHCRLKRLPSAGGKAF